MSSSARWDAPFTALEARLVSCANCAPLSVDLLALRDDFASRLCVIDARLQFILGADTGRAGHPDAAEMRAQRRCKRRRVRAGGTGGEEREGGEGGEVGRNIRVRGGNDAAKNVEEEGEGEGEETGEKGVGRGVCRPVALAFGDSPAVVIERRMREGVRESQRLQSDTMDSDAGEALAVRGGSERSLIAQENGLFPCEKLKSGEVVAEKKGTICGKASNEKTPDKAQVLGGDEDGNDQSDPECVRRGRKDGIDGCGVGLVGKQEALSVSPITPADVNAPVKRGSVEGSVPGAEAGLDGKEATRHSGCSPLAAAEPGANVGTRHRQAEPDSRIDKVCAMRSCHSPVRRASRYSRWTSSASSVQRDSPVGARRRLGGSEKAGKPRSRTEPLVRTPEIGKESKATRKKRRALPTLAGIMQLEREKAAAEVERGRVARAGPQYERPCRSCCAEKRELLRKEGKRNVEKSLATWTKHGVCLTRRHMDELPMLVNGQREMVDMHAGAAPSFNSETQSPRSVG